MVNDNLRPIERGSLHPSFSMLAPTRRTLRPEAIESSQEIGKLWKDDKSQRVVAEQTLRLSHQYAKKKHAIGSLSYD